MARQKGIFPIEGTIGNVTFFKSQDGYMVKQKSEVSADKINNDPAFDRTRENMSEFAKAAKGGKLLREALRSAQKDASDARMVSRLTGVMTSVIYLDKINPRGQRNVIDGEAILLEGFDFNASGKLSANLFAPFTLTLDRASGNAVVDIPSFIPANMVAAPTGTTHLQLLIAAAAVDFSNQAFANASAAGGYITWNRLPADPLKLSAALPPASPLPLFLALSVQYFQEINGTKYPLKNGIYNACSIVKVDTP